MKTKVMRLKNIKGLCVGLICSILLNSCSENFVDLQPISETTTVNFYQTADDIRNAVNGAYAALQADGISIDSYVFGEIRSDNAMPVPSGSVTSQDEFDRFYIQSTNPYIEERWNDSYRAISRCNIILERIENIEMEEDMRNMYIGEVKFIRAYVYFELVRTYGDVPLVLKEIQNPNEAYEYGRNLTAEVYSQIESDLQEAEAALSPYNEDLGRATGVLAQLCLLLLPGVPPGEENFSFSFHWWLSPTLADLQI